MEKTQLKGVVAALIIGLAVYFIGQNIFGEYSSRLLGSIAFLVTLWTNEALPLGVVSLLPIILFPSLGILDTNTVSPNYAKSIIFLFIGGFLLAIAVETIGLHKVIANRLLAIFPSTPLGIIYSLSMTSAMMSAFLSNTTTALLLISVALFLTNDTKLKARFVLAVAYGASIGGIMTPIGTPPNLILMGFLESRHLPVMPFVQWSVLTVPLAVVMLLIVGYILSIGVKKVELADMERNNEVTKDQKKLRY